MPLKIEKINWLEDYDKRHRDSIWWGGELVEIDLGRYSVVIGAYGEIRVFIDDEYYCDKSNGGTIADALKEHDIYDDKELSVAINIGRIEFENNNWYEFTIYDKQNGVFVDCDGLIDDVLDENDDFQWLVESISEIIDEYEQ